MVKKFSVSIARRTYMFFILITICNLLAVHTRKRFKFYLLGLRPLPKYLMVEVLGTHRIFQYFQWDFSKFSVRFFTTFRRKFSLSRPLKKSLRYIPDDCCFSWAFSMPLKEKSMNNADHLHYWKITLQKPLFYPLVYSQFVCPKSISLLYQTKFTPLSWFGKVNLKRAW